MATLPRQKKWASVDAKRRVMLKAGVPPRFCDADVSDFSRFPLALETSGTFLYGKTGTGKTHALAAGMSRVVGIDFTERFINTADWTERLRQAMFERDPEVTERQLIEEAQKASFLFIDDLGVEAMTDWTHRVLYLVLNHRYNYMLPTFFSSNCSLDELAERIGERIPDRINGMCADIIEYSGQSKRGHR